MAKVLLALAAVALTASLCQAAGIDIENAVVGKDLSGRKLMRNLMGDDYDYEKEDYKKDYKKDDYKKDYPKKEHYKKDYPKYKAKTCYATSTYVKDPTTTSTEKVKKYYKKVTYEKQKKVTYTTYSISYYDTVVKKPKYKTYVKYDVKTYDPEYKKYAVKYYQKKGWGEKWHIPKECQKEEPVYEPEEEEEKPEEYKYKKEH